MIRFIRACRSLAVLLVFSLGSRCTAGIVITIDHEMALAGETILLGVYASSDSNDRISGFNLPFDVNNDGFVGAPTAEISDLPPGFSVGGITNLHFSNTDLAQPFPQTRLAGVDYIVNGEGPLASISGDILNPTKLFDIAIQVGPNVPVGTVVPFQIKVPELPFFNITSPDSPTVFLSSPGVAASGSITIYAVPEPSSIVLSMMIVLPMLFGLGRRLGGMYLCRVP